MARGSGFQPRLKWIERRETTLRYSAVRCLIQIIQAICLIIKKKPCHFGVVSCEGSVICHLSSVVCYLLSVFRHPPSVICHLSSIT
jgi:hypothetical protein